MNIKAISRNVGLALLVSAFFMFLSLLVSLYDGKDSAFISLLISFLITFIVGVFPFIFVRGTQQVSTKDGYIIIVLSWLLSFVFGMMPYVMWGGPMSIGDAWFESVSGFTTTGSTILENVECLPRSLLFWRSSTHFIGGLGVVVFMLLVIPSASPFHRRLSKLELSSLSKEGYQIQSHKFVMIIAGVYCSIFALAVISLLLAGMPLFDAVNHGFALCSTGGFSTRNESIAAFNSPVIKVISLFIMVLAATNFATIFACAARRSVKPLFSSHIFRFYISSLVVMSLLVVLSLHFHSDMAWGQAFLDGFCTVVSYTTTTGVGFCDNSHWPFMASAVLLYASLQCACAGSTSSGIKVDRMIVVFKSIARQLRSQLHPSGVQRIRLGESYMDESGVLPIILYIVLYLMVVVVSVTLLLLCGMRGMDAASGVVASLGNVGPALGSLSAMCSYHDVPSLAKFIFTMDMFLGRLEIYPLLIVFSFLFKRDK